MIALQHIETGMMDVHGRCQELPSAVAAQRRAETGLHLAL
jgi:hypothetical protein